MTQEVLKVATNQFNENVCLQENVPSPEIRHSDCDSITSSRIDWQSYLQYPFILCAPLAQFPYFFNTQSLLCPTCPEDAEKTDQKTHYFLSRTNHWFNGRLKRYNPRLLYHTNSRILLVSCMYRCKGHEVSSAILLYCRASLLHIFFKFRFVCFTSLVLQRMPFISFKN